MSISTQASNQTVIAESIASWKLIRSGFLSDTEVYSAWQKLSRVCKRLQKNDPIKSYMKEEYLAWSKGEVDEEELIELSEYILAKLRKIK